MLTFETNMIKHLEDIRNHTATASTNSDIDWEIACLSFTQSRKSKLPSAFWCSSAFMSKKLNDDSIKWDHTGFRVVAIWFALIYSNTNWYVH